MYPYNIVENQAEEAFRRAKELGIGVIAMKPIAGGAFREGTLALKYILKNENITCAIPGMGKVEEVEENAKVCDLDGRRAGKIYKRILRNRILQKVWLLWSMSSKY